MRDNDSNVSNTSAVTEAVTYVIDADSGWERDPDVFWVIDEGNEADWEDAIPEVLEEA